MKHIGCEAAVLDVNLGFETSERVAPELKKRGRPFVALSGYSHDQHPTAFSAPALYEAAHVILTAPVKGHRR